MKYSQEGFLELVEEAFGGTLQLPAFQRNWKWEPSKIISLYDSLRKQFPIGSFVFLDSETGYDLSPRPYLGSASTATLKRVTLDGQQRIASGIILLHNVHPTRRFFLNLKLLLDLAKSKKVDYHNDEKAKEFARDIIDRDNYMFSTLTLHSSIFFSNLIASSFLAKNSLASFIL